MRLLLLYILRINVQVLLTFVTTAIQTAYIAGRRLAIKEGKQAQFGVRILHETEYPKICSFSLEQILDEDFYG